MPGIFFGKYFLLEVKFNLIQTRLFCLHERKRTSNTLLVILQKKPHVHLDNDIHEFRMFNWFKMFKFNLILLLKLSFKAYFS